LADDRLPVPVRPFGPFHDLALEVHGLTVQGRNAEALRLADRYEGLATVLGDSRTVTMVRQGRMYALIGQARFPEALDVGEVVLASHVADASRTSEAKALADIAEVMIKSGRLDEGLHRVARAISLLEQSPRSDYRYLSALSSLSDAARAAELYELADESVASAADAFRKAAVDYRSAADLQRAELLLEWGVRLEQIGRETDAAGKFARSLEMVMYWVQQYLDSPLTNALLALALAKTGHTEEALQLSGSMINELRRAEHLHEARLLHLAYGSALRAAGDLVGARREFAAGYELAEQSWDQLIFQYELARVAAELQSDPGTRAVFTALQMHAHHLWQLRRERNTMLQQARRRVELEAARARADRAAYSDALTGLGNRRLFDRHIDDVDGAVVLLLVDVDKFKGINDRYSHGVGDQVLRDVAAVLRAQCRPGDVAVRFGGDEFALFLRTDLETAARIGERIRQVIAARDWNEVALGLRVTLSMGVAALTDGMSGHELFDSADRNLYAAKRGGRDRLAA
jgi:diguanylate cyclase